MLIKKDFFCPYFVYYNDNKILFGHLVKGLVGFVRLAGNYELCGLGFCIILNGIYVPISIRIMNPILIPPYLGPDIN